MDTQGLRETFDRFDADKNGTIDFVEFKQLMTALDSEMDNDSRRLAFGTLDENQSGTIQFDEFQEWWLGQN